MPRHNRGDRISIILISIFIVKSCLLTSANPRPGTQLNPNQQCPKTYMCDPSDRSRFLQCVPNFGIIPKECPHGLLFHSAINGCDSPHNSDCVLVGNLKSSENDKKAENCNSNTCRLPDCKCPDDLIPDSLKPETVPQIVLLTFDDGVNIHNIDYYRKLDSQNLTNPDGCPIGLTFFVSGENTNYQYVEEVYQQGHEIASHSKTHRYPISWWSRASYEEYKDEMVGMRNWLSKRSHISVEKIKGIRVPFLQTGGDAQYQVLRDNNFIWDSTMVVKRSERPTWPFTLDYKVTSAHCQINPCPKRTYPGLWEIPLIQWRDSDGTNYSMADENKKPKTKSEMFDFFRDNFEVHYKTNRAPFGIFIHATWFKKKQFNQEVLQDFLKYLTKKKDVWVIPVSRAIDWVRNPKPISSPSFAMCKSPKFHISTHIQQMYFLFLITYLGSNTRGFL